MRLRVGGILLGHIGVEYSRRIEINVLAMEMVIEAYQVREECYYDK